MLVVPLVAHGLIYSILKGLPTKRSKRERVKYSSIDCTL